MKKYVFLIIALLVLPVCSWSACTGSSPTWSSTPDYASVSACISGATAGDTINVEAGTATWTSTLVISKAVTLSGAGIGNTVITKTNSGYMLSYTIPSPAIYSLMRITGFTFDCSDVAGAYTINNDSADFVARIRIDHNNFVNVIGGGMRTNGNVFGVIDSNAFEGAFHADYYGYSGVWSTYSYTHDSNQADMLYFEDNTINTNAYRALRSLGGAALVVHRYNSYDWNLGTSPQPLYDSHGNQGYDSNQSTMGYKDYGNYFDMNGVTTGGKIADFRGGSGLFFYNQLYASTTTGSITFEEEADDCYYGHTCTTCDPAPSCSPNGQPQHISDFYFFNNRRGATGTSLITTSSISIVNTDASTPVSNYNIASNVDFWYQLDSVFDGTVGVGCGTLANRPGTCTVGVGYWIPNSSIDPTATSCTNLTGYVGASNEIAAGVSGAIGTLYKCTDTNTWTAYYTPYTYPHPLRTDAPADVTAPTNIQAGNSINADGDQLTLTNSESCTKTGAGAVTLACSGGEVAPTYTSGSGGAIWYYGLSRVVNQAEVCTVDFAGGESNIEDLAGNDMEAYSGHTIVNGSTIPSGGDTFELSVAVVGGGTVNSSQGGIQCTRENTPCTKTVDDGTVITFTLVPYPGHNEGVITGTGCGTTTTMSEARSCTVTFPPIYLLN